MSKLPKFQEPAGTLPTSFVPDATQKYLEMVIPDWVNKNILSFSPLIILPTAIKNNENE